jgi:hypothetical protein
VTLAFWIVVATAWLNFANWVYAFRKWRRYSRAFFRLSRTIGTGELHSLRVLREELAKL